MSLSRPTAIGLMQSAIIESKLSQGATMDFKVMTGVAPLQLYLYLLNITEKVRLRT